MKKFFLAFLLLISSFTAFGQTGSGNRVRTYDVQHYIIRTSFDHPNRTVFGDTIVRLKPLKDGFNSLVLDAAGLKFDSVTLESNGNALQYTQTTDKVTVSLDKAYAAEDVVSVRFKYSAQPKKGVYFVDERKAGDRMVHSRQIWTQGEPEEAHHWFPSYDFPDDKATSEQILTVRKGETAIANGELLETIDNPDGTRSFHYRLDTPHSTYLTSFVIGNYVKVTEKYKNIPLGYYVYPGRESIIPLAYGQTADIFRVFEELTGIDYPYKKYDQTIVANFQFGGMENVTATTMADTEIFFAATPFGREAVMDLVSHEIAHSWFGNLVTMKNWQNLWLNEGFATFLEAAYREKLNGRTDYMRKIREDANSAMGADLSLPSRHALLNTGAQPNEALFSTTTYKKGGAVVHTLREEVGDENFWKAINIYLNRHKFGNTDSADLKRAFEETSGQELDWFFDQWVYKTGFPQLSVRQTYNPANGRFTLTFTQTQQIDKTTPAAFTLPLDVEIQTASGTTTDKIRIDKRTQTFTFEVKGKPTKILLDKDEKIPLKIVKMTPMAAGAGK